MDRTLSIFLLVSVNLIIMASSFDSSLFPAYDLHRRISLQCEEAPLKSRSKVDAVFSCMKESDCKALIIENGGQDVNFCQCNELTDHLDQVLQLSDRFEVGDVILPVKLKSLDQIPGRTLVKLMILVNLMLFCEAHDFFVKS